MMVSQWNKKSVVLIGDAVFAAMVVGYVGDLQAGTPKKSLSKMCYYGGPKSPISVASAQ
jgi:hypothetical protein